ncbi:hypothetical protein HPB49_008807 [Dermacentor silvarum]|uniref:Uncharacterized protein n=1 Tax=Dermacentor silvarum TaxID=543639 RepID=A0ACB8DY87_DERSI|nr:hypothetical protein HPB49_008807 [Dermacentor silvarum]
MSQILACSALVKVVGDFEEMYIAHDAWFLYRGMLRIQKQYIFPWHRTAQLTGVEDIIPGHTITMSSYAGKLVSWDNFYLSSTGLAITETSLVNSNQTLWDTVVPESGPLTWIRSAIATRLALTSEEWVDIIGRDNSGTCNNQILVLDYKLFVPGTPIVDGTLWLYEQLPMHTSQKDISQELRDNRYWASYNIAYFPDIFIISDQPRIVEQYGDLYTFENCPRAKIFKRDHVKVKDMNSMLKLMRYNDFRNDPFSVCNCTPPYNPTYAVAARYDLMDPQGIYDTPGMYRHAVGGIDAKHGASQSGSEFVQEHLREEMGDYLEGVAELRPGPPQARSRALDLLLKEACRMFHPHQANHEGSPRRLSPTSFKGAARKTRGARRIARRSPKKAELQSPA